MFPKATRHLNARSVELFEGNSNLKPLIEAVHALNEIRRITVNTGVLSHRAPVDAVPFYIHKNFWTFSLSFGIENRQKVDMPFFV
jgi:hypothetical protein